MSQHGTFYVITANPGVRPNRLKKLLLQGWFPALEATSELSWRSFVKDCFKNHFKLYRRKIT